MKDSVNRNQMKKCNMVEIKKSVFEKLFHFNGNNIDHLMCSGGDCAGGTCSIVKFKETTKK